MATVVGQRGLCRKLAFSFSAYTLFLDDPSVGRPTPLVFGPSGSGKTFAIELCCQAADLPYTVLSSAGASGAGYKGVTLRDLLAQHYLIHRQSEGIIFIDEVDKKMRGAMRTTDGEQLAMGTSFQAELLRYVEREDVYLQDEAKDIAGLREVDPDDPEGEDGPDSWVPVKFGTTRCMWVLAGAFDRMHLLVQRRLQQDTLMDEARLWEQAAPEDFRNYGMLPELINRCDVQAHVRPLRGAEIVQILEEQEAPRLRALFNAIGCELELDGGALAYAAQLAVQEKTGARGAVLRLRHVVSDCFTEADREQLTRCSIDAMVLLTGHLPLPERPTLAETG